MKECKKEKRKVLKSSFKSLRAEMLKEKDLKKRYSMMIRLKFLRKRIDELY